jgi:site-specific recombinase XerC
LLIPVSPKTRPLPLHRSGPEVKISEVGGSLRDVQQLAGHASLGTTARYIEGDHDAQRKVVALI